MVFSSTIFLFLFLPIVVLIYYSPWSKSRTFRNRFLLFASLVFYAWGELAFLPIMLFSITVGWYAALQLEKTKTKERRKKIVVITTAIHVFILFIFKYLIFTLQQFDLLFNTNWVVFNIPLPIGISFFTFQLLSYIYDIYYGNAPAQKKWEHVALYISLFPQLIAGPIVRYNLIKEQILSRKETLDKFCDGMMLFIYGLGKKLIIANYVAQIADNIFNSTATLSVGTAWLGAVAYTLQIYFDFSGYSDMAIGLGRMFGFEFNTNFNYPYIAGSVTDFWRRWHISLSSWFRDYVYIPLGGNRVSKQRWIYNLFLVWLLTGIWHGANWTFLVWGLFYFVLLLFEKITNLPKIRVFSHIYTLVTVITAWVIFRSESLTAAAVYIGRMFGIGASGISDPIFVYYLYSGKWMLLLAIILSMPVFPWIQTHIFTRKTCWWYEPVLAMAIFLLSIVLALNASYNPFIYFNF